jgi:hypothetical protein
VWFLVGEEVVSLHFRFFSMTATQNIEYKSGIHGTKNLHNIISPNTL